MRHKERRERGKETETGRDRWGGREERERGQGERGG